MVMLPQVSCHSFSFQRLQGLIASQLPILGSSFPDGDHHSIQHDEIRLILHDGVRPAACRLRNTVATPREDGNEGKHEPGSEELELGIR